MQPADYQHMRYTRAPKKFQLGVFGDSYCDPKGPFAGDGWFDALKQHRNIPDGSAYVRAESGANNWWAYLQFLESLEYNQYDTVIFSITDIYRMPIVDKFVHSSFYNAGMIDMFSDSDRCGWPPDLSTSTTRQLITVWDEYFTHRVHEKNLLTFFITKHIITDLIETCKRSDIRLIFIVGFGHTLNEHSDYLGKLFPEQTYEHIIHDLDIVSYQEMQRDKYPDSYVEWNDIHGCDARCNHLTLQNNIVLAKAISDLYDATQPQTLDFSQNPNLDFNPKNLEKYGKLITQPD